MPTIRLKDGDFGADTDVTVGLGGIYLPDPVRPGVLCTVAFEDIVSVESIANDRSGQISAAADLAVGGLLRAGPLGLLNGARAIGKVKDVVFRVRLKDGRSFDAVANAKIYAEVRSDWVSARGALQLDGDDAPASGADAIISRYLRAAARPAPPQVLKSPASADAGPDTAAAADASPATPEAERRVMPDRRAQPSFGRRRPQDA